MPREDDPDDGIDNNSDKGAFGTTTTVTESSLSNAQQQEEQCLIRPIPLDSVRQIVAGQVIFDLASAVKELLDNALDAQGKTINSTLRLHTSICSLCVCECMHSLTHS